MYYKKEIYQLLNDSGIVFESMEHDPVYTMEEMDALGITAKGTVCKNLFLRDAKGKTHYIVTAPEEKKIDLKVLAERIGSSRLSFASAERLQKYLAVQQGCVSPLGALNDETHSVVVVFDKDLQNDLAIGIHPNDNTASIWISFSDLQKLLKQHGVTVLVSNI